MIFGQTRERNRAPLPSYVFKSSTDGPCDILSQRYVAIYRDGTGLRRIFQLCHFDVVRLRVPLSARETGGECLFFETRRLFRLAVR